MRLELGDTLFLMTDGVLEAMTTDGELFGRARLEAVLRDLATASSAPSIMAHAVTADVARFTRNAEPADDLATLVLAGSARRPAARYLTAIRRGGSSPLRPGPRWG